MRRLVAASAAALLLAPGHSAVAQRGAAGPQGLRDVSVAGIPGVVAAGSTWTLAWQGTDNADGIVGTADGGLLFAQEQPSQVSKLAANDRVSVLLKDTHGAGALTVDARGRIIAVERTCTDPGKAHTRSMCRTDGGWSPLA